MHMIRRFELLSGLAASFLGMMALLILLLAPMPHGVPSYAQQEPLAAVFFGLVGLVVFLRLAISVVRYHREPGRRQLEWLVGNTAILVVFTFIFFLPNNTTLGLIFLPSTILALIACGAACMEKFAMRRSQQRNTPQGNYPSE
jgi:hypothetical protein